LEKVHIFGLCVAHLPSRERVFASTAEKDHKETVVVLVQKFKTVV